MRKSRQLLHTYGLCVLLLAATQASGDQFAALGQSAPTTNLLSNVVARLPQESLAISGQLHVRKARGIPVANYGFEMQINWGKTPPGAIYTISTTDGIPLEQLELTRLTDGKAQCRYFEGASLKPQDAPPLSNAIRDTDISWTDLTLDFLWWPRCVLVGDDSVKGRTAIVADVYPPDKLVKPPYARVRVWIDQQAYFLLRAQGYSTQDTLERELWVKSFKKIDDRWMIKDLEVQRHPSKQRTKLRVYHAEPVEEVDSDG
ncbi:MAG: outer membrane lipoprotein-sorting protein [Kiritimatiellae bacterium]|nr:outer membrane lipoprotein-sorting protein [Kiritimatiellia bacterium]